MTKQEILNSLDIPAYYASELPGVNWNGTDTTKTLCCFHEDKNPSLSINQRTGGFNCFACGTKGSIFDFAMKKHGVDFSGARAMLAERAGIIGKAEPQRKLIKTYDYTDASGELIFQACRYEPKDFRQRRPGGKGGWIWNLQGVQLIPYNLPELIKSEYTFIVEGEKDVESLRTLSLVASCNAQGAGKWKAEYNQYFKGKRCYILSDNDNPGRDHALQVARSLKGIAASVKVIELPGLPEKGDISDWIAAQQAEGKTAEGINVELRAIVKACPEWMEPAEKDLVSLLPTLSDLAAMDLTVDYVLEGIIPEKAITVLYGRGGRGKTTLMLQAGYCIAEGLPFEGLKTKQMPVIYCDWDNPLNVICDKAKRLGSSGNFHYWHSAFNEPKLSKLDKAEWEIFKKLPNNALLIFDTLKSCQGLDMNKDETMAFILERFRELRDLGFTIVILHHTPRGEERPKNNTTITDNADHSIGIISAKPSATGEEGEDGLLFFGCGEADKSRYAKHYIYLSFDGEVFERVQDPEDSKFEGMRNLIEALIKEGVRPNQSKITEAAIRLNLTKSKAKDLLNKGESKHWKSTRIKEEKNQKIYELIQFSSFQTLYSGKTEKLPEIQFSDPSKAETLQTLDAVEFTSFPDPPKKTEKLPEIQFSDKPVFQDALLKTELDLDSLLEGAEVIQ